jgi:hypothetical protein
LLTSWSLASGTSPLAGRRTAAPRALNDPHVAARIGCPVSVRLAAVHDDRRVYLGGQVQALTTDPNLFAPPHSQ